MAKIHLVKREAYTAESFQAIVENLGLSKALKAAGTIAIKPNLVGLEIDNALQSKSTPLWMIESTVAGIRQCNSTARILILESDSGTRKHARDKFLNHGLPVLEEQDDNLVLYNLSENPTTTFDFQGRYFRKRIEMPSIFQQEIFFISLSKVKTHRLSVLSGVLKNQYGCLPMIDKSAYHPYLDRVLADLNTIIRPALSILDACPAMEGDGPLHGQDRNLNIIACSDNPVELDAYLIQAIGLNRYKPPYLQMCREALKDHYAMGRPEVTNPDLAENIRPFTFIGFYARKKFQLGLLVQRLGQKIANAGKRIQR